jgi:hypothetical protein
LRSQGYPANFAFGNIVFANPGQVAEIKFITTDCLAIGSKPSVAWLPDEVSGTFANLTEWSGDPAQLDASETIYAQRFWALSADVPAKCRHA